MPLRREAEERFTWPQRCALSIAPPVAAAFVRLLGATLRITTLKAEGALPADESPRGDLYPFWHQCLLIAAYRYRHLGIHILISDSFDGELIARTVSLLGFVPVRGSSSRGGAAALLQLTAALAAGHKCAITADGPRGPARAAKPGAAAVAANAAKRSASVRTISAFNIHAASAWRLRSWDRFVIPRPFSRVIIAWAGSLQVIPNDPRSLPKLLQDSLDVAAAMAGEWAGDA